MIICVHDAGFSLVDILEYQVLGLLLAKYAWILVALFIACNYKNMSDDYHM